MHIELELDDRYTERLLSLQKRLNKPLQDIVAELLIERIEQNQTTATMSKPETQGQAMLNLMEQHGILGCMEGDGNLSVDYKKHLWGNE